MKKALIMGGGFAGCAAAHQLELLQGWDVTIVEKAPFLGAGVRTNWLEDIHILLDLDVFNSI